MNIRTGLMGSSSHTQPPLDIVTSIKGGTGKSTTTECVLVTRRVLQMATPILFDADLGSPDVSMAYESDVFMTDIREVGFSDVIDGMEDNPTRPVLLVTGSNDSQAIKDRIGELGEAASVLKRPVRVFWPIDLGKESYRDMDVVMAALPQAELYVVRNLMFGPRERFTTWAQSEMKRKLGVNDARDLDLPKIPIELMDLFRNARKPFSSLLTEGPLSQRMALESLRKKLVDRFGPVLRKYE